MDLSELCNQAICSSQTASTSGSKESRKSTILDKIHIEADLTENTCAHKCKNNCSDKFKTTAGIQTILEWRQRYHSLKQGFPKQIKLVELYKATKITDQKNVTWHVVEGTYVCRQFWYLTVMKLSRATYFRCVQMVNGGVELENHSLKRGKSNFRGQNAVGFRSYVRKMGDPSPETERILMPVCVTKKSIYEEYKVQERYPIGLKRFYQIIKLKFKHVSFPKCLKNSITGCDICILAKDLIAAAPNDSVKQALIEDRNCHLHNQQVERDFYYERRADAIAQPNLKGSLIADGMDQAKTDLPHYKGWKRPKTANKGRLRTHILGVILHGQKTHFFIDLLQWPHDANLVLNGILNALHARYGEQKQLPETLYIQLDNCGRENKNRYVLGFFNILVQIGLVKEVVIGFLMQGHTHEDIDQRFSKVSHIMKRRDARTLPELRDVLKGSLLNNQPVVTILDKIFDIKDWISDCLEDIHNHSHPHVYWIRRISGKATMYYKMWSTDESWQPEGGLQMLKLDPDSLPKVPTGKPGYVESSWDKQDFEEIKKSTESQKHQFNYTQWAWWASFLESPCIDGVSVGPVWWLDTFHPQDEIEEGGLNFEYISPLSLLINKQNRCPTVQTGKKQQPTSNKQQKKKDHIYQPCIGIMAAVRSKVIDGEIKIGKIEDITETRVVIHVYDGKLTGILKPAKCLNGNDKLWKIARDRLVYLFQLTSTNKVPALAQKKIREYSCV